MENNKTCHMSELRCNASFRVYITSYAVFCWLTNKYFAYIYTQGIHKRMCGFKS